MLVALSAVDKRRSDRATVVYPCSVLWITWCTTAAVPACALDAQWVSPSCSRAASASYFRVTCRRR